MKHSAAEIEEALATEDYDEAAALQLDAESAQADVAALVTEHGFQVRELCEDSCSFPLLHMHLHSLAQASPFFGTSILSPASRPLHGSPGIARGLAPADSSFRTWLPA